jgi:glycosyltransferase involved in cell wall biosynthesis
MSKFADYVVLQSPGLTQRLVESIHISQDKVRIITNSVNTDFWTPDASEHLKQKSKFKLLYVGGVDNSHGLMSTLRVMKEIYDLGHEITLNLIIKAGIGELDTITKYIGELGLIPFVQIEQNLSRKQMKERYNSADALVYQTINDGSPRVVLEAMACGLPIVASNHPGINILDPDSKIISFTSFCDEKSIKAEIVQLIENTGMGMRVGEAGKAMVLKKFDTKPVAKQYAVFYQETLLEKARS